MLLSRPVTFGELYIKIIQKFNKLTHKLCNLICLNIFNRHINVINFIYNQSSGMDRVIDFINTHIEVGNFRSVIFKIFVKKIQTNKNNFFLIFWELIFRVSMA